MAEVPLYNKLGAEVGALSLPDSVFGSDVNLALVHQAVVAEEANQRQGTADTKTRGEVSGGGKKPWRQKGTGHARQGSIRAPHWRTGGVVFGPHPRDYRQTLPRKMRRGALRSALSAKVAQGQMIGLDELIVDEPKTREIAAILKALPLTREIRTKHWDKTEEGGAEPVVVRATKQVPHNVLLIVPDYDPALLRSCRNIPYVTLRHAPSFSVRDVVTAGRVVLAQGAVAKIEEVLGR